MDINELIIAGIYFFFTWLFFLFTLSVKDAFREDYKKQNSEEFKETPTNVDWWLARVIAIENYLNDRQQFDKFFEWNHKPIFLLLIASFLLFNQLGLNTFFSMIVLILLSILIYNNRAKINFDGVKQYLKELFTNNQFLKEMDKSFFVLNTSVAFIIVFSMFVSVGYLSYPSKHWEIIEFCERVKEVLDDGTDREQEAFIAEKREFFASLSGEEITLKCKNWDARYQEPEDYYFNLEHSTLPSDEHYIVVCGDGYSRKGVEGFKGENVIEKMFYIDMDELSNKWKKILKEADRYPDEHEYPLYITGKLTRVVAVDLGCSMQLDYERKKYGDGYSRDIVTLSK